MEELRYCIECGRIVSTLTDRNNIQVHVELQDGELLWCEGPFTLSTPPENFEEDWDIDLTEPSFEEMAAMNLQAEMLLQELEG